LKALPQGQAPPKPRRMWRRVVGIILSAVVALLLSTVLALALIRNGAGTSRALSLVDAARPWLIGAQMAILVLAWHCWPRIVAAIARHRSLSPAQHDALLRGRNRVFLLLGACELLIVLRALAG
jgi:hypothetical protein